MPEFAQNWLWGLACQKNSKRLVQVQTVMARALI